MSDNFKIKPGAKWLATPEVSPKENEEIFNKPAFEAAPLNKNEEQLGKDLASLFKDNNVHPVLIFGSKGSGKTSLLVSLFRYMRDNELSDASIELADEIFPIGDARWKSNIDWAQDLFFKKVFDFIDNNAPATTQESEPFFIPVKLTTKSGNEKIIAFLEGKGEWYQSEEDLTKRPYKKFKGLLQALLINFNDPLTVIYVAPFVEGSEKNHLDSSHIKKSDIGLLGAINEYLTYRKVYQQKDSHLLLVTKWDVFCESIASESFSDPSDEDINEIFRDKYRLSWNKYLNLNLSNEHQNKSISTYSAGFMDGKQIACPAKDDLDLISAYPRKLWDWIYENATGGVLYPDVRPKTKSLFEKIISFLRGND